MLKMLVVYCQFVYLAVPLFWGIKPELGFHYLKRKRKPTCYPSLTWANTSLTSSTSQFTNAKRLLIYILTCTVTNLSNPRHNQIRQEDVMKPRQSSCIFEIKLPCGWHNDLCPCLQEGCQRLHNLLRPAEDVRCVKDVQSLKGSGCTQLLIRETVCKRYSKKNCM